MGIIPNSDTCAFCIFRIFYLQNAGYAENASKIFENL